MTIIYALHEKFEEIKKASNGKIAKIITKAKGERLLSDKDDNVTGVEYVNDDKASQEYELL
jgi:hypothetical protein